MELPTELPGLFTLGETRFKVATWRRMLLASNFSSQCVLEQAWFCKASERKQHEFLVLFFAHWDASVPAIACVVVDRTPKSSSNDSGSSTPITLSSGIASPSALQTAALDSVSTTPCTGINTCKYLTSMYGPYNHLCTLTFPPTSTRPSATQISVLLSVTSTHAPNYNLYHFQCYWYASTIWEAIKQLFPGYIEGTWQGPRCHYYGFKVEKADSVEVVCEQYVNEWTRLENEAELQRRAELQRQAELDRIQQTWKDGVAHGLAQSQALIDRLLAEIFQLQSGLRTPEASRAHRNTTTDMDGWSSSWSSPEPVTDTSASGAQN
ncbi:uncharacterized protein HD556DRAFT_1449511 [Suillus plorans]|uniref:Uncharacterized protein n=1 Tax=Suillus plorans TaxID=116603 RepID=A0A9P7AEI6_9AGAM|nr:uncharacterized protein HD556DRAFT_1449511 [Suillus plorans]KAG1786710.1 hypothetical protein HD556DRAFT_1449511 [Suillus plorans]